MQLHETASHGLVEGIALVVGSQVEVVQGLAGAAAVDGDGARVQHQADVASDVGLGGLNKRIQGALQRAEPQAVVNLVGPLSVDAALEAGQLALDGDCLQSLVCADRVIAPGAS